MVKCPDIYNCSSCYFYKKEQLSIMAGYSIKGGFYNIAYYDVSFCDINNICLAVLIARVFNL